MKAHYGYADGSGEYYITIDTDKCDGCGSCVEACRKNILEIILDDYDESKASVKRDYAKNLSYVCLGHAVCEKNGASCRTACANQAIEHSW